MRLARPFSAAVLLAGALFGTPAACAPRGDGAPGWQVSVDTLPSGALHVVNTPPETDPAPTWVAREELRIGAGIGGGPESFGLIRSIAVLPDGRIAAVDGMAEELRVFDRAGAHLRTFGGQGAGPGELSGAQGVLLDRDGLLRIPEQRNARLSVFHPDTGFVRSHPLRLYSYRFSGPWEAVLDDGGRTLVASSGMYRGGSWDMLRVYDSAMAQVDSVPYEEYTALQEAPGAWLLQRGNAWGYMAIPFYAAPQQVLGPSGEFWSSVAGAATLQVARWTPAGDTTLLIESRRPPVAVTTAERDSAIADVTARLSPGEKVDFSMMPATHPPLHGVSLDDRGRLWARTTPPTSPLTRYDVFEGDGRYAGTVEMAARVDAAIPPLVRGDTLWAVVTDALDLQYVVRSRLERPSERDG